VASGPPAAGFPFDGQLPIKRSTCWRGGAFARAVEHIGRVFMAKTSTGTIYVLNGPNLNLLGTREPQIYGRATLNDVEALCRKAAAAYKFAVEFRQSNHEGAIVDWIHEAGAGKAAGIVINPAGLTHTSVSVHDAIKAVAVPTIEVHITNIHAREPWRHHSYVSLVAKAVICGFGIDGYALAIDGLAALRTAAKR
jgi:3-dehydroquinate dehydratase-2